MIKSTMISGALSVALLFAASNAAADDAGNTYLGSLTLAKVETSVDSGLYHTDRSYVLTKEGRKVISVRALQYLPGDKVDVYQDALNGRMSFCQQDTKTNCYKIPNREQKAIMLTLAEMRNKEVNY